VPRPIKELKGFTKVFLQPCQSNRVTVELDQRSFAYYDVNSAKWTAATGKYNILVGASSPDIRLTGQYRLKTILTSEP
jgi:beta-glucosidase